MYGDVIIAQVDADAVCPCALPTVRMTVYVPSV
jgi:hypothetical protein